MKYLFNRFKSTFPPEIIIPIRLFLNFPFSLKTVANATALDGSITIFKRSTNKNDGRIKTASLTRKGKKVIDKTIKIRFKEASDTIIVFNENEKKEFSNLLKKMLFYIDNKNIQ